MRKIIFMSAFLFITGTTQALADRTIGVDYLMLTTDVLGYEANPTALQLRFSNEINPVMAIEGAIALGVSDDSYDSIYPGATINLTHMFGVFAKAGAEISPGSKVYARLGLATLEYEDESGGSDNDSGMAFGFGVSLAVSGSGAVVIEYNQWPDLDADIGITVETTVISVGFQTTL